MSNSIVAQIPKNLLFRYRVPCRQFKGKFGGKFGLDESYRLPHFGSFERQRSFADVRVAWNEDGLFFDVRVTGKTQTLWCRQTELLESDGMQVWIDTRDTHNIHRASKFCHWFAWLPLGGGANDASPLNMMLKINRSSEDSPTINRHPVEILSETKKDGYRMRVFVSGKCLNGWDTADHQALGFNYAIQDREFGWQTLAVGPELPIREDPSLWQTIELIEQPSK